MKPILTQIFVTLGVMFLLCILAFAYFFVTDPFNLKPMLFGSMVSPSQSGSTSVKETSEDTGTETGSTTTEAQAPQNTGFELSAEQKAALVAFGIDPSKISRVSPEQETCFIQVLGKERVEVIKAGAVPSMMEFFQAKACI